MSSDKGLSFFSMFVTISKSCKKFVSLCWGGKHQQLEI